MLRCMIFLAYILNFLPLLQDLLTESSGYLLDELFLDIALHFSDILTSKWQNSTDAIDTVCETLQDYFEDYQYLKPKNFESVVTMAQDRVACSYIESMLKQNVVGRWVLVAISTPPYRRKRI